MRVELLDCSEYQFLENVAFNAMLAKRKAKKRQRIPWRVSDQCVTPLGVPLSEVMRRLQEDYGITVSARTLSNFKKTGEIDRPITHGAGRGKGKTSYYSLGTVEKAAAAWKRRHPNKCKGENDESRTSS